MKNRTSIFLILISLVIFGVLISKKIEFNQNVTGYLKRAADANTIKLANEEISKAINYLERNQLTSGYTSIFWKTPDEEIDFWYKNLKASQNELQHLETESTLVKTNVLIKFRETLLDTGERTKVTVPKGLSIYPNNKLWGLLIFIAISLGFTGLVSLAKNLEKKQAATK